ncbi:MAG: GntR family transcriptional regulator [Burkholderiaceae bacterium]
MHPHDIPIVRSAAADNEGSPRSLTTLAFERLRSDILAGELRPTEKLRIHQLAERYDIGPTAIREALSRLVTEGMVTSEDQRGFCVAGVSRDELLDLTRTRLWVEQTALRASIEHGDVEWEATVLASIHRLSRIASPNTNPASAEAWRQAHRQFHFSLIQGCGSPWTVKLCAMLYDQTQRYRSLSSKSRDGVSRDVSNEHRQIADAALARDARRACALLAEHFDETTRIILALDGMVGASGGGTGVPAPRRRGQGNFRDEKKPNR